MKKKFKTRIVHYLDKCYVVEYASYYLIPFYEVLKDTTLGRNIPELFSKEQADFLILRLKSIEDIKIFDLELFYYDFLSHEKIQLP